ncbi:MAG: hypothetical protein R3216_16465, partial [Pseudomonas sp.]|nr:hypothetical protein [Pseudomonas sp.]
MHPLLPSLAAASLYAGATFYQGLRLSQRSAPDKRLLALLGVLALLFHGGSLFLQMSQASGLSLDFFNAASLIAYAVIAQRFAKQEIRPRLVLGRFLVVALELQLAAD